MGLAVFFVRKKSQLEVRFKKAGWWLTFVYSIHGEDWGH